MSVLRHRVELVFVASASLALAETLISGPITLGTEDPNTYAY